MTSAIKPQDYFVLIKPQQLVVRTYDDSRQFRFHHFDVRGVTPVAVETVVNRVHQTRIEAEAQMFALFGRGMFPDPQDALLSALDFLHKSNPVGRIRTYQQR